MRPAFAVIMIGAIVPVRALLRWTLLIGAVTYPVAIGGLVSALAFIGERWWPTTVALYLPGALFAAPLPLLTLALLVWGPRWLLIGQALAAGLILFPLMGLELGGAAPQASTSIRVLSYNVDFGTGSRPDVREEIARAGADVVLLQGSDRRIFDRLKQTFAGMDTRRAGEFYIASRYPILDFYEPPPLDGDLGAGFVRATLDTPIGVLDVYNLHPVSPRPGFEAMRENGQLVAPENTGKVERNAAVRGRQLAALAAHAHAARNPVVLAGDTNLPGLSPLLREHLGDYQDGFAEVGRGFGYTFPAHRWPWMRIDRILAGPELYFVKFTVGDRRGSDHLCVIADLARR